MASRQDGRGRKTNADDYCPKLRKRSRKSNAERNLLPTLRRRRVSTRRRWGCALKLVMRADSLAAPLVHRCEHLRSGKLSYRELLADFRFQTRTSSLRAYDL